MKNKLFALLVLGFFSTLSAQHSTLFAQGTAFTYNGRLSDGGSPANGHYDLRFSLFDADSGPNQVGGTLTNSATAVSNGLFTATLDFGAGDFTGANRWLEMGVRSNGGGAFTTLVPRSAITPTPYAIYSANAGAAATATTANFVPAAGIVGTVPMAQLPPTVVTNGARGVNITGTFSGNAGGLTNLSSASLTGPLNISLDPVNIGHANNGGYAYVVAISGNYVYLANGNDGLRVYDISNPADPLSLGHTNNGGFAIGVAVSGDYAYLANDTDGLRVYDISNPANPVNIGHIDNGGGAADVAVSGNYAYLANDIDGLRVYDISNPANPVNIGHIDDGGAAIGVAVSGNYAYLANQLDGLRVYDISNPANPVNIAHTNNGYANGVVVSGNYAYVADHFDGLRVYDISNPANPVNIGHANDGGFARGVAVSGNYAYLANQEDGLRVYDISNPANPINLGHTNDGGTAIGVAVSGHYAYLGNHDDGLRVYALDAVSAGNFRGDGSLLTHLDASKLTTGTIDDARLSANVALLDGNQTFSGANTFSNAGNSFTGNGAGLFNVSADVVTGGLTTNIAVLVPGGFTNILSFTNGILRNIQ